MRLAIVIGISILSMGLKMPPPSAQVERLYWDHVEGFYVDSSGREIYIGSRNRLYFSNNFGLNWTHLGDLPSMTLIRQILPIGKGTIFIVGSRGPCGEGFISTDSGHTFSKCLDSTGSGNCAAFVPEAHTLFVACDKPFKLLHSMDSGCSWIADRNIFDSIKRPRVCSLLISEDTSGRAFYVSTSQPAAIYRRSGTTDRWHKCFSDPFKLPNRELPLVTRSGNRLVACLTSPHSPPEKIYLSDDWGASWRGVNCPVGIWGIGLDPHNHNDMWIGNYGTWIDSNYTVALQYTEDEGRTWMPVAGRVGEYFWQLQVLTDHTVYAATDFGLIRVKRD